MIGSIHVALSGMLGHERALNLISNNVSNMNTRGFRGSTLHFSDLFARSSQTRLLDGRFTGQQGTGQGVDASRTLLDLRAGDPDQTGRGLDLLLQGAGYFVLQDEHGVIRYTRDGSFEFDADGVLVVRGETTRVMSRNTSGELVPLTLENLKTSAARATTQVVLSGNLVETTNGSTTTPPEIGSLDIFDANGIKHTLTLKFAKSATSTESFTDWTMTVLENDLEIGSGTVQFIVSSPAPGSSPLRVTLALAGIDLVEIAFDFGAVSGISNGQPLAVQSQDGFARGTVGTTTFDAQGVLQINYTNGQKASGPKLVLAQVADEDGLVQVGGSRLEYHGTQQVALRDAGDDLKVAAQFLERSNVDLAREFSELILMQRGYQASSQVLSTANEMIQQLLDMRRGR